MACIEHAANSAVYEQPRVILGPFRPPPRLHGVCPTLCRESSSSVLNASTGGGGSKQAAARLSGHIHRAARARRAGRQAPIIRFGPPHGDTHGRRAGTRRGLGRICLGSVGSGPCVRRRRQRRSHSPFGSCCRERLRGDSAGIDTAGGDTAAAMRGAASGRRRPPGPTRAGPRLPPPHRGFDGSHAAAATGAVPGPGPSAPASAHPVLRSGPPSPAGWEPAPAPDAGRPPPDQVGTAPPAARGPATRRWPRAPRVRGLGVTRRRAGQM